MEFQLRLLKEAASRGNSEAQCALGLAFLLGDDGAPHDPSAAASLFRLAAEQGDARAMCNLGAMYAQGLGVSRDLDEAREWYQKSSDQDCPDGMYNLAVCFSQGLGCCSKDMTKALRLCEKAAAMGQEKAMAMLPSLQASCCIGGAGETSRNAAVPAAGVSVSKAASAAKPASGKSALASPAGSPNKDAQAEERHCTVLPSRDVSVEDGPHTVVDPPVGRDDEDEFSWPKPGAGQDKCRKLYVLHKFASTEEVAAILHIAQTSLDFDRTLDSVDGRPSFERYVIELGQYVHDGLEPLLRPIVEERLLPYVRCRYGAPNAVVCSALMRRYLPQERRIHPTHLDGHAFCTAVLCLNSGFRGGYYVESDPRNRSHIDMTPGDLAVHQWDLPHGVHVRHGERYSLVFWVKDCVFSCVANETPWYDAAAAAGDADAMAALGQKLAKGMNSEGVGSDPVRAVEFLKRAADIGQTTAQTNLGVMYFDGRGVKANDAEAFRWWRRAAEAGDSAARRMLVTALVDPSSPQHSPLKERVNEAIRWMLLAAEESEDVEAMFWLSQQFGKSHDLADAPVNARRRAWQWLLKAADLGHPEAQCQVGAAYLTGDACDIDEDRRLVVAASYFRRAAFNGSAAGECNLGAMYAQGLGGLSQDLSEALRWYRASAEKGNRDGQYNLAIMYFEGLGGIARDSAQGRRWCEQAVANGHNKAGELLASYLDADCDQSPICEKDVEAIFEKKAVELANDPERLLVETAEEIMTKEAEEQRPREKGGKGSSLSAVVAETRQFLVGLRSQDNAAAVAFVDELLQKLNALDV
eukprot:TRINITY_DN26011_c0_g1_i1.p1 TRINITY_DN26011_c0_g1~~TRINITY_DN26011_c0_g1_i1.p1  ORF type:complete len:808 (-),score=153.06 TRINITY_DN26011_c0_g1_i1:273-2696(-)